MANNENVNKVVFGDDTIMDITDTTAEAADVASGKVFYAKSGARTLGTASGGGGKGVYYGTCTDQADVAAKTVTCAGFELEAGAAIAVYFQNGNTSISTTLNVGRTGAKPILFGMSSQPVSPDLPFRFSYATVLFVYNGEGYVPQSYCENPSMVVSATSTTGADTAAKTASSVRRNVNSTSNLYLVAFSNANTVQGALTLSVDGETARPIHYGGAATSASNPLLWDEGDVLLFARDITSRNYTCVGGGMATDMVAGSVKTNSAQSITLNASGQLEVGGRLGQTAQGGLYYPLTSMPVQGNANSFLLSEAVGLSIGSRSMSIAGGNNVTLKVAAQAGATAYQIANTQNNRFICACWAGGRLATSQAGAAEKTVGITSVKFANGNDVTPYFGATEADNNIIVTVDESLNTSGTLAAVRGYGKWASTDTLSVGQGNGSVAGKTLLVGMALYTNPGGQNQIAMIGNRMYTTQGSCIVVGADNINTSQFAAVFGEGHDTTGAPKGVALFGRYSRVDGSTLMAVGNGTSYSARKNAFEVTSDGGIVLCSPNGTRWKIAVDDSGNITTTAI